MLKNTVLEYKVNCEKTLSNPEYDLIYRSRYSEKVKNAIDYFSKIYKGEIQSLVMSDFLMFNKYYNVNFLDVDRLLSYCKIKVDNNDNCILDGWHCEILGMYHIGSNVPNKKINFDMSNYYDMELIKTDEDKWIAIRTLIQIMNEIPEEEINLNNYYTLSEWYNYHDSKLVSYQTNLYGLKNKEEEPVKSTTININKLLTKKEIMKILYSNAKYGSCDYYDMFGCSNNITITEEDIMKNKIGDAVINTVISDEKINLEKYLEHNGSKRTNAVINDITNLTKNRINCSLYKEDITPEELLVEIHNNSSPFGMGYMSHEKKQLTLGEAKEILSKYDNYIDYLNGIAFKLNFSMFPILDVRRFEDRNRPMTTYLEKIKN